MGEPISEAEFLILEERFKEIAFEKIEYNKWGTNIRLRYGVVSFYTYAIKDIDVDKGYRSTSYDDGKRDLGWRKILDPDNKYEIRYEFNGGHDCGYYGTIVRR